jgi:CRP-like cAMP-binding protein
MILKRVDDRMRRGGKRLMVNLGLAHLVKEHRFLASTDAALSVAEDELLAQLKGSDDDVLCELADFSITRTLSVEEREVLSSYLMREEYEAGSDIRTPDEGPALHLLARGRAALIVSNDGETRGAASYCAGTVLADMGDSRHPERSRLVAQTAVVVFALPASALANLRAAYPAIVATLMTNLVFHFDRRCSDLLGRLHAFEDS